MEPPSPSWRDWVSSIPPDVGYVVLLLGLFVVPRLLQHLRIPRAITALALGFGARALEPAIADDATIHQLATFGIVSLFLFAGLEVELQPLRKHARLLTSLASVLGLVTAGVAYAAHLVLGLDGRAATLVALAVLTPSAGFILESFDALGASRDERFWIRTFTITSEILALLALFVTLRSESLGTLAVSTGVLLAMIGALPLAFRWFAEWIVPRAPRSEFAFLIVVAVACALITKHLGVYYLVGAFVVGMVAQRFRRKLPALASENMLGAIESFASVFVPFYFFDAGLAVSTADLGWPAIATGFGIAIVCLPLRWLMIGGLHSVGHSGRWFISHRIGVAMMPTLVFTLVLARILRDSFGAPEELFGGLIVYAVISTMSPTWFFSAAPPEFDAPQLPDVEPEDLLDRPRDDA